MPTQKHLPLNYQVRWKNFRGFIDTKWLEIRPLTVLIGPNNSGKTSIFAPLLLLKQTIESPDPQTHLVTRGPLIDVGDFRDLIHAHDQSRVAIFAFRYHTHKPPARPRKVGDYQPGAVELTFAECPRTHSIVLRNQSLYDIFNRPYLRRTHIKKGTYAISGTPFLKLSRKERNAILHSAPTNFFFEPGPVLTQFEKAAGRDAIRNARFSKQFGLYLAVLSSASRELLDFFLGLTYIGPLRAYPKRHYEVEGDVALTVGPTGEHAPNLLRHRYSEIKTRLNRWVRAFEIASNITFKDISDGVFQILLESPGRHLKTNLADAGFGVSQLLPLIIQALTAARDSITIAEQPEIHLNPRLQSVLADLFVEMATARRPVVVETHSEHLLLRLRRLVATGKIPSADVALYFLDKTGDHLSVRLVPIQPNGNITVRDWPKGFFADSLREALALAAAQT